MAAIRTMDSFIIKATREDLINTVIDAMIISAMIADLISSMIDEMINFLTGGMIIMIGVMTETTSTTTVTLITETVTMRRLLDRVPVHTRRHTKTRLLGGT